MRFTSQLLMVRKIEIIKSFRLQSKLPYDSSLTFKPRFLLTGGIQIGEVGMNFPTVLATVYLGKHSPGFAFNCPIEATGKAAMLLNISLFLSCQPQTALFGG